MWVVMNMQDFTMEESPDNLFHIPVGIRVDSGKMVGFLPVYETKEAALEEFPDAELKEIRIKVSI